MRGPDMPEIQQCIQDYLDYLRNLRRLSTHTLASYAGDLEQFSAFCGRAGLERPEDITYRVLRQYLAQLQTRAYASSSVQRKRSEERRVGKECRL